MLLFKIMDFVYSIITIVSHRIYLFNGQIKFDLKIYTFNLSLNVHYITIYMTAMFHLLTIFYKIKLKNVDSP